MYLSDPLSRGNGSFRTLAQSTLRAYSTVVVRAVAFSLRWLNIQRKDSSKLNDYIKFGLEPKWKGSQLEICNAILDELFLGLFYDAGNLKQNQNCISFIHQFLVYAFTTPFADDGPIDSITEQIILLSAFSKINGWRTGSTIINEQLKAWQYVSRATLVHCAFLNDLSAPYTPPPIHETALHLLSCSPTNCSSDDTSESESEDEDDGESKPRFGLLDFSILDNMARGLRDASGPESEGGEEKLLVQ